MSKIKKFLNENKMGKLIARLLGKEELAVDDNGKPVLSQDEKTKILNLYGDDFLKKFEEMSFASADAESTHDLFDAAVAHAQEVVRQEKDAVIAQLRQTITQLTDEPENAPAATAVSSTASTRPLFHANMTLGHNKAAADYLSNGVLAESTTIDVADLKQELGAYSSQGNNLDMLNEVYQSFTTSKELEWKRAVTEYKAVSAKSLSNVVQQFKKEWNAKGGGKFTLLTVKNYRHKVDFPIDPVDVGESWLFHLYDEGKTPDQMPITRYIVSHILMPQIGEDLELVMTGKAKYVEGSDETSATMNGIETQLVDALGTGTTGIQFFKGATNLLEADDDTVLSVIDDFVASVAPLYRNKQMPVYLSADLYLKYKRAYKKKWGVGSGTENTQFGSDRVDFSNFYLKVLDCLTGSPIFFSTPRGNFVGLKHKNPPQFITDIQRHDREVRFYLEFWYGVGFLIGEAVFAYVPAGYDPSTVTVSARQGAAGKWVTSSAAAANNEVEGA